MLVFTLSSLVDYIAFTNNYVLVAIQLPFRNEYILQAIDRK